MEHEPTQRQLRRFVRLHDEEPEIPLKDAARIALGLDELQLDEYLRKIHAFFIAKLPRRQLELYNKTCRLANREALAISSPIALG